MRFIAPQGKKRGMSSGVNTAVRLAAGYCVGDLPFAVFSMAVDRPLFGKVLCCRVIELRT